MELLFLGTGTSDGIPVIGCQCKTCISSDVEDIRTRSSVFIKHENYDILIDASIDLRSQFLREDIKDIDCILFTHHHADHIYGLDDIRPISQRKDKKILCYASRKTCDEIKERFSYFFNYEQLGGGVPQVELKKIESNFSIKEKIEIIPIEVFHGKLPIYGFRIEKMAYITDASVIPENSYSLLKDLDVLVINALRFQKHSTHFSVSQAVTEAEKIGAKKTFLTHICHAVKHSEIADMLRGKNIFPAYDGLKIVI